MVMRVVTVEEMRAIEKASDANGTSFAQMMDNAGRAVATWMESRGVKEQRVLVLVGPGNNGGDGLVAAHYLSQAGATVTVYVWKRETDDDANWARIQNTAVRILTSQSDKGYAALREEIESSDWVIDALLGTGTSLPIKKDLQTILAVLNESIARGKSGPAAEGLVSLQPVSFGQVVDAPTVVALDVPTGLDSDSGALDPVAVHADATVTLGFPKLGLFQFPGAEAVGELVVANIGIPDEAVSGEARTRVLTPALVRSMLPSRPADAHKGTFGKVMVVAGSVNYTGAPYLAASGAMRVGAGLVTVAVAESLLPVLASKLSEATYVVLPHDMGVLVPQSARVLHESLAGYDVLLFGPGMGHENRTVDFVREMLAYRGAAPRRGFGFLQPETALERATGQNDVPPLVIDADGLYALSRIEDWPDLVTSTAVLTPHPGEMARLLGTTIGEVQSNRVELARESAQKWGCTVVLKGAFSVIASPDGVAYLNPFATPALATAGSGDVLAGVIAGFVAQGLPALNAALVGTYVHALAGQIVEDEIGRAGAVAGDVLGRLPIALQIVGSAL